MAGHSHYCGAPCRGVVQTLDELDFERGIWYAAQHNDQKRVEMLLKNGVPVDVCDTAGYTALHYAARAGHVDMCQLLLNAGANVDARTRAGLATPLHRAASAGKEDVVSLLLSHGSSPRLQDADGETALHRAAIAGHTGICNLLLMKDPELRIILMVDLYHAFPPMNGRGEPIYFASYEEKYNVLFSR